MWLVFYVVYGSDEMNDIIGDVRKLYREEMVLVFLNYEILVFDVIVDMYIERDVVC